MRYYSYIIPDDNETEITKIIYSEQEVLEEFWEYWCTEMRGNGYADLITKENCISDWTALHWAQREDVYKFKNGYDGKVFIINEFNMQDPTFSLCTVICVNDNGIDIPFFVNLNTDMEKLDGLAK